jgi:hypothetical protein
MNLTTDVPEPLDADSDDSNKAQW